MRQFLILLFAAAAAVAAANEVADLDINQAKFADHTLSLAMIEREWHDHHFFSTGETPGIKMMMLSFAQAYPNELTNRLIAVMMGVDREGFVGDFVLDEHNGYASGALQTELDCSMQMCYWKRTDGDLLIAVALQGYEYKWDGNREAWENMADNDEEDPTVCVNDLMFFKLEKGEVLWLPKTPKQITGRDIDFKNCRVELPRHGKDICLVFNPQDDNPTTTTLRWNGLDFTEH